jgi:hypothetical protein
MDGPLHAQEDVIPRELYGVGEDRCKKTPEALTESEARIHYRGHISKQIQNLNKSLPLEIPVL